MFTIQSEARDMKPWYLSKTFWVNVFTLAIGIAAVLAESEFLADNKDIVLMITALVVPLLNVFLRWLTDMPITSFLPVGDKLRPRITKRAKARSSAPGKRG